MYADAARPRSRVVRPSPVFLAFVALAAGGGWLCWSDTASNRTAGIGVFALVLGGWVVSLCLHEFGHAYAAYQAGDRSVEAAGYLTLNPFKYAHPLLSIVLPLLFVAQGGIGLPGGAVYLHRHQFRSRVGAVAAAAAGPLANLAMAVLVLGVARSNFDGTSHLRFWGGLAFLGFLQISAALLNLLPIPGLDGYAILEPFLRPNTVRALAPITPWGMIGVFVLLQVQQVNTLFFTVVNWLYQLSGAPRALWEVGSTFFRFWRIDG